MTIQTKTGKDYMNINVFRILHAVCFSRPMFDENNTFLKKVEE